MGIDLETLLILAVLAFILFGPEKLPEYAAMLGKFVAKMRQATTEMTRQYQDQNPFHYPPEPHLPPAYPRIRPLNREEIDRALTIINQAAIAYKGVIPADCWHEPYMPEADLRAEMAAGVTFWGYAK